MSATHHRNRALSSPFPAAGQARLKKGHYYKISSTNSRGTEIRSGKHPNLVYACLIGNVSIIVKAVCGLITADDAEWSDSQRQPLDIEHAESFLS